MTTARDVDSLAEAIDRARPEVTENDRRIIVELYRLLGGGHPVETSSIAQATRLAEPEIETLLEEWPGVYRDDRGRVVGFWGLTVKEMPPHEITLAGRKLWAWCAWDTLFLPRRFRATLDVRSVCPVTGVPVSLRVSPHSVESVEPSEVVVSFLEPNRSFDADVISSFCHFVHFFANREAGKSWTSQHPGTFLISLDEAFELGKVSDAKVVGIERS